MVGTISCIAGNVEVSQLGGGIERERMRIVGTAAPGGRCKRLGPCFSLQVHSLPSRDLLHTLIQQSPSWAPRMVNPPPNGHS